MKTIIQNNKTLTAYLPCYSRAMSSVLNVRFVISERILYSVPHSYTKFSLKIYLHVSSYYTHNAQVLLLYCWIGYITSKVYRRQLGANIRQFLTDGSHSNSNILYSSYNKHSFYLTLHVTTSHWIYNLPLRTRDSIQIYLHNHRYGITQFYYNYWLEYLTSSL